MSEQTKEGWGPVTNAGTGMQSKKWHYFKDHRALCGRWMRFSDKDLEQGKDNSPDNCAECRRRLLKLQAKNRSVEKPQTLNRTPATLGGSD